MERNELKNFLEREGYKQDQWGHYKKEIVSARLADGKTKTVLHRYKMQKNSVRHEIKLGEGKDAFWHKRWSEYYCNLKINNDGKIARIKDKNVLKSMGKFGTITDSQGNKEE